MLNFDVITLFIPLFLKHVDELDSYMFQTVGHHAIDLYSQAMGLPLYRAAIKGGSVEQGRDYHPTQGDEVEDLYLLLEKIKASSQDWVIVEICGIIKLHVLN